MDGPSVSFLENFKDNYYVQYKALSAMYKALF